MAQNRHKIASALREVWQRLGRLVDQMEAEESEPIAVDPKVASKVAATVASRQCLQCGRDVGPKELYRRGLCPKCYRRTNLRLNDGSATEGLLETYGILAPVSSAGRPRKGQTALDELLAGRPKSDTVPDVAKARARLEETMTEEDRPKRAKNRK